MTVLALVTLGALVLAGRTLGGYRVDPLRAWQRAYRPRSLGEIRAEYETERPECGADVTERLIWDPDCPPDGIACQIPYVAPRMPGGCALEDAVE